jgi:hypothetical protein
MKQKYPVTPEHIAYRKQLRRENIRAAWLQARHRVITEKCAVIEAARKAKVA